MYNSDGDSSLLIGILSGAFIYLIILYNLIAGASRSKRIERELKKQNAYLREIALKQGVDVDKPKQIDDAKVI